MWLSKVSYRFLKRVLLVSYSVLRGFLHVFYMCLEGAVWVYRVLPNGLLLVSWEFLKASLGGSKVFLTCFFRAP